MRIATVAMLAVTSAGLFACSSSTSKGALNFPVAESLLVLDADDPTAGYALLSSATGNCPALQRGVEPQQIGNSSYLLFLLTQFTADGGYAPLAAGTYTLIDPNGSTAPTPPALVALSALVTTDSACNAAGADATSGTVTVAPFSTVDGGVSTVGYDGVYNSLEITGTSQLTTCLILSTAPYDAGTCVACVGPGDGGPCTVQ